MTAPRCRGVLDGRACCKEVGHADDHESANGVSWPRQHRATQPPPDAVIDALAGLVDACADAYKAGRIPAEPFVRARNVLADARSRQ